MAARVSPLDWEMDSRKGIPPDSGDEHGRVAAARTDGIKFSPNRRFPAVRESSGAWRLWSLGGAAMVL